MEQTVTERFIAKTRVTESGCLEWTAGCFGRTGYGGFWLDGRTALAHRVSYEMFVGPIPPGLELDHLCRNRRCVNPAHLEAVTRVVNLGRGDHRNARKTRCPQGHEYTPENTYVWKGMRYCRTCNNLKASLRRRGLLLSDV